MFCIINESCGDGSCQGGQPRNCDDGLFCNGPETCSEEQNTCISAGNPCPPNTQCDEANDRCIPVTPAPHLDKDACQCNLDANAPRSRNAGWIWLSAAVGLLIRRRTSRNR
jgi:hypothetical protein